MIYLFYKLQPKIRVGRMDKNHIIGYFDYFFDKYEYSRIGMGKGKLHVDSPANNIEKVFQ